MNTRDRRLYPRVSRITSEGDATAMSPKHYIEVAKIIRTNLEWAYECPSSSPYDSKAVAVSSVARDLACMFRQDNPAFDRAQFYMACGLDNEGYEATCR